MPETDTILTALAAVIADRRDRPPEGRKSYVASLIEGGVPAIAAKIEEEAGEVIEAAAEPGEDGRAHLVRETADLVFHTMVLLAHHHIAWSAVEEELARRFGIGGFEEKAARGRGDS